MRIVAILSLGKEPGVDSPNIANPVKPVLKYGPFAYPAVDFDLYNSVLRTHGETAAARLTLDTKHNYYDESIPCWPYTLECDTCDVRWNTAHPTINSCWVCGSQGRIYERYAY